MPLLPDSIRYSETLEASSAELIEAVREQGFEGVIAKRRDSSNGFYKDAISRSAGTLRPAGTSMRS
jgi:hypothetical protein